MIKKFCDRCGKEIREPETLRECLSTVAQALQEAIELVTGEPRYRITDLNAEERLELCRDCHDSLKEWMKAGDKAGNNRGTTGEQEENNRGKIVVAAIPDASEPGEVKFGDF